MYKIHLLIGFFSNNLLEIYNNIKATKFNKSNLSLLFYNSFKVILKYSIFKTALKKTYHVVSSLFKCLSPKMREIS